MLQIPDEPSYLKSHVQRLVAQDYLEKYNSKLLLERHLLAGAITADNENLHRARAVLAEVRELHELINGPIPRIGSECAA